MQLLPRKANEPPVVFHWLPIVGSAVGYGTDPLNFFAKCREKVCTIFFGRLRASFLTIVYGYSTAMSLPLFFLVVA